MTIPLHFMGEEDAPGVKLDSGIMVHGMTSVDVYCLATALPEYIEVDVSGLEMGGSVHLGAVALPDGVEFASTVQESDLDLSVASVLAPKKPQTVEDDEVAEGDEGEESSQAGEQDSE